MPATLPICVDDPTNARILAVSEDRVQGFSEDPFEQIRRDSGVELPVVLQRIAAMLEGGTIRRVRQTLMTTSLAPGALVAWQVPSERLNDAFDHMFRADPFSGHVVIRTTDQSTPGSQFRLWTTLKVPQGYSMTKHCEHLATRTGATRFETMPAKCLFTLGVGHVRRRGLEPGSRADQPAQVTDTKVVTLDDLSWRVLMALKRPFEPAEIAADPWRPRALEAGLSFDTFMQTAADLSARGLIGRFSTFLEHVKKLSDGTTVTKYNALFHWAVPPGRELETGREVGRHHVMTHAYWRETGPEFNNVNIMGVAHGTNKDWLLAHKAAIDTHIEESDICVGYTNVFWGGRSEIKPSEISPIAYREWCSSNDLDPESMRDG